MRKLIVAEFISLDGVIQAPGAPDEDTDGGFAHGGWTHPYWHDEIGAHFGQIFADADTLLLGRKTWQMHGEAFEPNPEGDPFSGFKKYVVSNTLKSADGWRDSSLISGDAVEAVRELKREGNSPMRTLGSLTLCRSLLKAGLVDRFRVVVFPVITGSSGYDRIYDGYPDVALDMVASRTFDGRIQLLEYVPRVLSGPPGAQNGS